MSNSRLESRSYSGYESYKTRQDQSNLRDRRQSTWNRRKHSPGVEWREKWTADSWKQGRVLLIDYVARGMTE